MLKMNLQFFAHKKGVGSTKNGRDSESKRLGAKRADGQFVKAGNILYKGLVHFSKAKNGNLITGIAAPVTLTSRSDSFEVKVNSLALGALVADSLKKNK